MACESVRILVPSRPQKTSLISLRRRPKASSVPAPLPDAVDPLGGASLPYWQPVAERFGLNLTIVNKRVDPAFGFTALTLLIGDWFYEVPCP